MGRKRYTVSWVSVDRHYKKQYDTLDEADERYKKVLESDRVRFVKITDNSDLLKPVTIKSASFPGR